MMISDASMMQQNYYLNNAQKASEKALENIAAVRAISGIDSANLAIADSLRSQSSTIDQGIANAYDAIGVLQIADASLTNISQSADRLNELSVKMNNAALSDSQKSMLRTEATRIQESINDSFNNATYNGKNVFQTMNFVVGSGTETTNLNPLTTSGLSIDNQDSITNFMDQLGALRSEIGSSINAITSNINASVQNSINTKAAENNLLNNDMAKNVNDFNSNYLKENAAAFVAAQSNMQLQSKIASLLQ
ncbi:flagellin C [Campylobacter coli]|uniref:Flagellin n=3 Tax=Campylobacter coli TaxID=195 RepID=A0A3Z8ISB8_CAMCO|nr:MULTISPECIES: flagellin C [Campylobacter]EAI7420490.1 flagellin [Campylobacter hyointestinalis]EIA76033.1 flagellin subunit protein FlaC [Campylobacter coli 1891]KDA35659.1 flagellin [Campylobacter jejuni K5]MBX1173124.1 flagellin C [Campylobacter jejuni]AGV10149.1 Flagellin C [Campylobacter coli CVM N29710]